MKNFQLSLKPLKVCKGQSILFIYEEYMSIDKDIPLVATLTNLEICQDVCEQDQATNVDDSDECVEDNPSKNAEMRKALDISKRSMQRRSTNF
ncbi:hypothetical protein AVEN_83983-1 [Araneus ventricosus]|uniref:Uncharacterized protein n=1 Tax=Araneus ventricosus TaxID=182803 RepID=A0A4Y2BRJ8_ARAVE|nr:hypothetical protein AVEN_83983-1 [Araneus ventricosus]